MCVYVCTHMHVCILMYGYLQNHLCVHTHMCAYLHSNAYVGVGVLVLEINVGIKAKLLKHKRPMNIVQSLISKQIKLIEFKIEIAESQR